MAQRIIVDARCLDGTKNGYATYTEWVIGVLKKAGHTVELASNRLIAATEYRHLTGLKTHVFGSPKNFYWEQFSLRSFLRTQRPDVYFCGQNIGLPVGYRGKTRLVLGILDMIPQRFAEHYIRTMRDRLRYQVIQKANARVADQILTISQASRRDIRRYMSVDAVTNTYIRQPSSRLLPKAQPTPPNFVYVGGVEWRKKLPSLLEAFALVLKAQPTAHLTLIGEGYEALLNNLGPDGNVRAHIAVTGWLPDTERNRVIRQSTAVVFPSLYEGYGLPIAEAFAQAVPVICGKGGSQPEVGGEAAVYCRPESAQALAQAMKLVQTKRFRAGFSKKLLTQREVLSSQRWDELLVKGVIG